MKSNNKEAMDLGKRREFHAHTFFGDGALSPVELVRYAYVSNHSLISITDHADFTNIEHLLSCQKKILGEISWDIEVLVGVELTHLPKDKIPGMVAKARKLGAQVVVVHGESPAEPVEEGTNAVAVSTPGVDVLAHPGNKLTVEEAELARENGVFLEISARAGHMTGNSHVVEAGVEGGASFLVDSDAHQPGDLISQDKAFEVAVAAGLSKEDAIQAVLNNPETLLRKIRN